MKKIEEVYEGVGEWLVCCGVKFIPCHVHGKDDNLTYDYLHWAHNEDSCVKSFLIPAIKVGEHANDDGFYPVYKITCHYDGYKVVADSSDDLSDFENGVFFDAKTKKVLIAALVSSKGAGQDVIIGKMTGRAYETSLLWRFIATKTNIDQ